MGSRNHPQYSSPSVRPSPSVSETLGSVPLCPYSEGAVKRYSSKLLQYLSNPKPIPTPMDTPSASLSLEPSNGSVGSSPYANSQPSGIPSRSESCECGSIGAIFMNLPGDIPAKIHVSPSFCSDIRVVTRPGMSVWFSIVPSMPSESPSRHQVPSIDPRTIVPSKGNIALTSFDPERRPSRLSILSLLMDSLGWEINRSMVI